MKLYHFTSTHHLPLIHEAGALLLTDGMIDASRVHSSEYPPVLWLLAEPELGEFSHGIAYDGWAVDKSEIRFTVEVNRAVKWLDWARAQQINHRWLETIVKMGGGWDAAEQWYISFSKVQRASWLEIRNMKTQEVLDVAGM